MELAAESVVALAAVLIPETLAWLGCAVMTQEQAAADYWRNDGR